MEKRIVSSSGIVRRYEDLSSGMTVFGVYA
jgi:hypothetical protein